MATVLRASGEGFDVDAFVSDCGWTVDRIYRRGEPRSSRRLDGRVSWESGLSVVVSGAGQDAFADQISDATRFLTEEAAEVRRLVAFPGVGGVTLDFSAARRDVAARSTCFPAALVCNAGACGVALEVSHYAAHE